MFEQNYKGCSMFFRGKKKKKKNHTWAKACGRTLDEDIAVIKIDMHKGFNLMPRQVLLEECSTHFSLNCFTGFCGVIVTTLLQWVLSALKLVIRPNPQGPRSRPRGARGPGSCPPLFWPIIFIIDYRSIALERRSFV